MEYENKNAASKGTAGTALGLGIAGTALGVLGGNLSSILGGGGGENTPVTRYEFGLEKEVASKDAEIALLKANTYNDQKSLELYRYIDGELRGIREALCAQAVHNQRVEDKISVEAERRCCADNAIVNYANATFYPKLVANVTAGTETTAQSLYNPIPSCGCDK